MNKHGHLSDWEMFIARLARGVDHWGRKAQAIQRWVGGASPAASRSIATRRWTVAEPDVDMLKMVLRYIDELEALYDSGDSHAHLHDSSDYISLGDGCYQRRTHI